jgi:hypothetical protein
MRKKKEIDPEYYDNHDFGEELIQAKKDGTLYVTEPGESFLDSLPRAKEVWKKVPVSIRLTNGLLKKARGQAAADGVPLATYLASIVYNAVSERPWAEEAAGVQKKKAAAPKKSAGQVRQPAKMKRAA